MLLYFISLFYFYRRGNDYTDTYGCNDVNGVLSPVIVKQFNSNVKNCILDGEMMCYNTKYKIFSTKGKFNIVKCLFYFYLYLNHYYFSSKHRC